MNGALVEKDKRNVLYTVQVIPTYFIKDLFNVTLIIRILPTLLRISVYDQFLCYFTGNDILFSATSSVVITYRLMKFSLHIISRSFNIDTFHTKRQT